MLEEQRITFILFIGIFLRWCVSLCPYSGENRKPMYGDYEAQRHWQEITINIRPSMWYKNSSDNDLSYWGIDYPPLSAYHSLIVGKAGRLIDPAYVELFESRGYESPQHKFFMRSSVIISDLLIYFPAAVSCIDFDSDGKALIGSVLVNPSLLLIDYAHFQYNSVSIGLLLLFMSLAGKKMFILASVAFCCALNFKQMELYHALPVFYFLLGGCLSKPTWKSSIRGVSALGITVILTFLALWYPWCSSLTDFQSVLHRIFPVGRGIYEDKVGNFWCTVNNFVKVRNIFSTSQLVLNSGVLTLLACSPCILLVRKAEIALLKLALCCSSLAFFLFSFHVHEKSILLFAVPASLLSSTRVLRTHCIVFINVVCSLSLSHLLMKDGCLLPGLALTFLYTLLCMDDREWRSAGRLRYFYSISIFIFLLIILSMKFATPPARYPDLFVVLLAAFSFCHFSLFYIIISYEMLFHA